MSVLSLFMAFSSLLFLLLPSASFFFLGRAARQAGGGFLFCL
jgi:hypothetical protein